MFNTVQSNLIIIGLSEVYWRGSKVVGVTNINAKYSTKGSKLSLIIKNGDPTVITELRNAGVYIRRER